MKYKIIPIFMLMSCTLMSMQNAQETRKLHSVLQELESQYKVKFSYVDQWIDNVLVHSPQTARGVKSALDEILLKVPISYTILDDKNILLFQDSSKIKPATEFKNEIKGSLVDAHFSQIVALSDSVLSKEGKDSIDTSSFQQLANADDEADDVLIKEQINVIPGNQHFESPKHFFHFSLWNQLNTNYPFSGPTIHNFSMNMISHESIGLEGIEIGLIGNFNRTFVKGFQIALGGNSAQTYMHGLQISGGANVNSLQVSGLQIAGGYNATEKLSGIQIGSANTAKNVTGGQIGGVNLNSVNANGAQIGVLFNRSKTVSGLQLAAVNQSELTTGVQVGLFNFGKKVKGIQVGLVNFSDDNTVAAIGLLNFIKNGQHHFEASMNESKFTHLAYRHGTKYFYTIYDVGVHRFDNPPRWSVGIGVGGVIYNYKMVEVNLDVMTHQLHENRLWERRVNLLNNIKLTPSFKINDHFALYGGVSANVWISRHNNGDVLSRGKVYVYDRKNTFVRGWWGYLVGIRI